MKDNPPLWFVVGAILALAVPPFAGYRLTGGYEAGFSWFAFVSCAVGAFMFSVLACGITNLLHDKGLKRVCVVWRVLVALAYLAGAYATWIFYTGPQMARILTADHFALSYWEHFKLDMYPFLSLVGGMFLLLLGLTAAKPYNSSEEQVSQIK